MVDTLCKEDHGTSFQGGGGGLLLSTLGDLSCGGYLIFILFYLFIYLFIYTIFIQGIYLSRC